MRPPSALLKRRPVYASEKNPDTAADPEAKKTVRGRRAAVLRKAGKTDRSDAGMKDQKTAGEPVVFDREHRIFSNNYKFSPRQIRRAVTLELFGASSLLLPGYLAENERDGRGGGASDRGAAALALLAVWDRLAAKCDFSVQEEIKHSGDGDGAAGTLWLRRILQVIAVWAWWESRPMYCIFWQSWSGSSC